MHGWQKVCRRFAAKSQSIASTLTPWQLKVERDKSWHRVVYGGRRLGKTRWISSALSLHAVPGAVCIYGSTTVTKARDQLWPYFEALDRRCNLGLRLYRGDFRVESREGATIQLMGIGSEREAEKIRGYANGSPMVVLDECGVMHEKLLKYAVEDCAEPATSDWYGRGGTGIVLSGNPSRNVETYWHKLCRGEMGFSVHHGTMWDNPWQPDPDGFLEMVMGKRKWTRATPKVRREYFGEFCIETEAMPYGKWDGRVLPQVTIPLTGFTILVQDFGQSHPNAWVVLRLVEHLEQVGNDTLKVTRIHAIHAEQEAGLTTQQVADVSKRLIALYRPNVIVGDGAAAQSIADLNRIHDVPIIASEKIKRKRDRIWFLDSLLHHHQFLVHEGAEILARQLRDTPWNEKGDDHHGSYHDHCIDAVQYGIEYIYAYILVEKGPPQPGTPEYEEMLREKSKRDILTTINRGRWS